MTTDKIIAAAREAGIEFQKVQGITGRVRTTSCGSQPIEKFARFYAIAYRAGMERAAEICEAIADEYEKREGRKYPEMKSDAQTGASDCEYAIRAEAHAKNQPESTHDTDNV